MEVLLLMSMLYACVFGSRFVFDDDNDFGGSIGNSALAIDQCFKPFVQDPKSYKYTCAADGLSVTKEEYTNEDCTSAATTLPFTPTSPCSSPSFECSGTNDYSMIKIYAEMTSGCDAPLMYANLPVVTGSCFCNKVDAYYKASCTSDSAGSLAEYSDSGCTTETDTTDLGTCTFSGVQTIDISYKMTTCLITPTPEPTLAPVPGQSVAPTASPTASTKSPTKFPTTDPVTSSPTATTPEPTQVPSSTPVAAPAVPTKFILDDDWILKELYPFPFDTCLLMQPQLSIFTYTPDAELTYYECNSAGNVDKYKWTIDEVPTIDNTFDCDDLTTAVKTEFVYDASLTNCDVGYFNCDGADSYATVSLATQIVLGGVPDGWDCVDADTNLLTTSIATDVCFCDSDSGLSGTFTCDGTEALTYNYTGSTCGSFVASQQVGGAQTCAHFTTLEIKTFELPVSGELDRCVQGGGEVEFDTLKPTYHPTDPPSPHPSPAPTGQTPSPIDT
eukprot:144117_1